MSALSFYIVQPPCRFTRPDALSSFTTLHVSINLGRSPVSSSIIGFGWTGRSEFYVAHDDESSLRTLERALELGVTHYYTSNVYGRGANEQLLGRFAKGKRDQQIGRAHV